MTATTDILDEVDWDEHASNMVDVMVPKYMDLLEIAWGDAGDKLSVLGAFDVKNPHVQSTVKDLAKQVTGMADSTKDDLRGLLDRAFSADKTPSTDEIAKQIRDYGITSSTSRSETIARSETATAYNVGAVMSYREANVDKVEVMDGDGDAECSEADGQIWSLEDAEANPIAHPNCTRAFAPVVE